VFVAAFGEFVECEIVFLGEVTQSTSLVRIQIEDLNYKDAVSMRTHKQERENSRYSSFYRVESCIWVL
jgi:hypothetical protein